MDKEGVLQGIMTLGTLGLLYVLIFKDIPTGNKEIFMGVFGFIAGYYFGSSNKKGGTSEKDSSAP